MKADLKAVSSNQNDKLLEEGEETDLIPEKAGYSYNENAPAGLMNHHTPMLKVSPNSTSDPDEAVVTKESESIESALTESEKRE